MRRPSPSAVAWVVGLVLSGGCSSNTGPTAGALNVTFSAQADEGAVLLIVSGGPVDSVESVGYSVYSARLRGDTLKLIITGNLASGSIARIHIPDNRQASSYGVRVDQVAARGTYAQHDPAAYTSSLEP